jgi:hypothetical protein
MISENLRPLMGKAEIRSKAVWAATTLSIVLVTALLWFFIRQGTEDDLRPLSPGLRNLALGLALALAVISSVIRSYLLSESRLMRLLEQESRVDRLLEAASGPGSPPRQAVESLSQWERAVLALPACLLPAFVVGWGINEAILLLGTALAVVSGNFMDVVPFAFVAFALNALSFPRLDPYLRRLRVMADG